MKRRTFLTFCSATGMTPVIGSWASEKNLTPNERPAIASIGVGGKGWADSQGAGNFGEMIAFCDVNTGRNRKGGWYAAQEKWPKATARTDWRKLLEQHADKLDGLTVTTPDHMHAPITMTALQLGIACYTQKPLTRTVHESRQLTAAAEKAGVATQMGNQHHNGTTYKTLVEWIRSGAIGKIHKVHTWSNRPVWPQGMDRPTQKMTAPDTLNWDLWLGVAPERPYHSSYQPFNWRGWHDFGAGALGDMGAHIIDPPVWALELGAAQQVKCEAIEGGAKSETFPESERIHFDFAGTAHTTGDTLRVTWHDGDLLPDAKAIGLPADFKFPAGGSLYVGETGTLVAKHGSSGLPQLFREGKEVKDTGLPKVDGVNHYQQWIDTIRGEDKTTSNFAYAGPLTETVLLGTVACRFPGETLKWNAANLKFDNRAEASALVKQPYRRGWEVEGLV
jgi:predicted dehydrogenase